MTCASRSWIASNWFSNCGWSQAVVSTHFWSWGGRLARLLYLSSRWLLIRLFLVLLWALVLFLSKTSLKCLENTVSCLLLKGRGGEDIGGRESEPQETPIISNHTTCSAYWKAELLHEVLWSIVTLSCLSRPVAVLHEYNHSTLILWTQWHWHTHTHTHTHLSTQNRLNLQDCHSNP